MDHQESRHRPARHIPKVLFYLVPLLVLGLFIGKPYHIDDVLFLRISEMLPYTLIGDDTGTVEFLGTIYPELSPFESTHPPLIPYYLKWVSLLTPDGSHLFWVYHLFFLVFPALILASARYFEGVRGLCHLWVWFLVFSPVFFVNATNLMTDVPMLAFWVASLCGVLSYCETGRQGWAWVSCLLIFAALMTSYQSIALLPLISVSLMLNGRSAKDQGLFVGLPSLCFLGFLVLVYVKSGFFPGLASTIDYNISSEVESGFGFLPFLHKGISTLVFLGFGLVVPTPLLLVSVNRRRLLEHLIFASILSFTLFHLGKIHGFFDAYTRHEILLIRSLILVGSIWSFQVAAKCVDGFRLLFRAKRPAGNLLIPAFWYLGVVAYNIFFMPYATARYILPALPPALILLFSHPRYRFVKWREMILVACAIAMSVFCAMVDFRQAAADHRIFQSLKDRLDPDATLWFSDDSGLNRYINGIGGHYLPKSQTEVGVGDYVLITRGMIHPEVQASLTLIDEFVIPSFLGFTLFDTKNRAGFYRSLDGFLPLARAPAARRAFLFKSNYFMQNRNRVEEINLSQPTYFGTRVFSFPDGSKSGVVFMHPDAKIAYPMSLDHDAVLSGRAVTQPAGWGNVGDGVRFSIGIERNGAQELLWSVYLDGKSNVADRTGRAFRVNIPSQTSAIWFQVGPGPRGDYRFDGAGWEDLRLERVP